MRSRRSQRVMQGAEGHETSAGAARTAERRADDDRGALHGARAGARRLSRCGATRRLEEAIDGRAAALARDDAEGGRRGRYRWAAARRVICLPPGARPPPAPRARRSCTTSPRRSSCSAAATSPPRTSAPTARTWRCWRSGRARGRAGRRAGRRRRRSGRVHRGGRARRRSGPACGQAFGSRSRRPAARWRSWASAASAARSRGGWPRDGAELVLADIDPAQAGARARARRALDEPAGRHARAAWTCSRRARSAA